MRGKLIKTKNQYILSVNDEDLHKFESAIDTDEYGWVIADEYGVDILKLSKQNCDEIFGVVDVEKLAEDFAKNYSIYPTAQDDTEYGFKNGFNKAMELYKPTEIEVEIEVEVVNHCDCQCHTDGVTMHFMPCCNPDIVPKLDDNNNLILRRI
jgi:hypothetical protein